MAKTTTIGWTDHTFNAWIGCQHDSEGCRFCYAEALEVDRYGKVDLWGPPGHSRRHVTGLATWRQPLAWHREALEDGRRHRVFCGSLMDVLDDHPDTMEPRPRLWRLIEQTPALDWQLLSKRPENGPALVRPAWLEQWPLHVWLGASVEDASRRPVERVNDLLAIPATLRFLSIEPLIGPVAKMLAAQLDGRWHELHWLIIGGESGDPRKVRRMDPGWARAIVALADAHGIPVFVKQLGTILRRELGLRDFKGENWDEWPADLADLKRRAWPASPAPVAPVIAPEGYQMALEA